jgi:hypothetical protein
MVALIIMSTVLIGTLCVLAYRLAVYALPVMLGFAVARIAYQTGAGMIGAGIIGFIAGTVAYGLLSVLFVSLRSPAARTAVGMIFALPAAGAGYALISGIGANTIPSELWRLMFCVLGGLLVGSAALTRLSVPATRPPAGTVSHGTD